MALALATGSLQSYDCTLATPYSISEVEGRVGGNPISFSGSAGAGAWQFVLGYDGEYGEVIWPDSPMQLSGKGSLIQTGPQDFAFFLVSKGPCLFTEGHCGSLVQFSQKQDRSMDLLLSPIAIIEMENGERRPFNVYLTGKCSEKKAGQ
ncbi:hypothetical protein [Blastomonas sp.]|uniref:hypothetical protein n=1 Tax=Blastomonas sp. TaxID=1909299 RepID=UPI00391BB049